jgi:hypothetical protein
VSLLSGLLGSRRGLTPSRRAWAYQDAGSGDRTALRMEATSAKSGEASGTAAGSGSGSGAEP